MEAVPELVARNGVDIMQVCDNGHWITSLYLASPDNRKQQCDLCGAKTLIACPHCHFEIPGLDHKRVIGAGTGVPTHCERCSERFPWADQFEAGGASLVDASFQRVDRLCSRFQMVARHLQLQYDEPESITLRDTYSVGNLLHAILQLEFDDIRPMEWNPPYARGSSHTDFFLKTEQILVEIKTSRATLTAKELDEQLNFDIARYATLPNCRILACFVFDPGRYIDNPERIKNSLERKSTDTLRVKVLVYPR